MKRGVSILWLVAVVLAVTAFTFYLHFRHRAANSSPVASPETRSAAAKPAEPGPAGRTNAVAGQAQTNQVFRVRSDQVLATVNGISLTLRDLIPLSNTNGEQELAPEAYQYFLDRAINRELIQQAAKAQGVTLTDSQGEQLTRTRTAREQSEPGLVGKLTVNAAEIEFESRDAAAFMLQTTLMARQGASPNVTPEQVEQYYQAHVSELGELPSDPTARQAAWQRIDIQIRELLADSTRREYNKLLTQYMDSLRQGAQIAVTPPPAATAP
jgi:hypothetical protein